MRQFKIIFNWTEADHIDEVIYVFAPEHTKEITADDFLTMMLACVSKSISECDSDAKSYIERYLLSEEYIADMGVGIVESVEEISA